MKQENAELFAVCLMMKGLVAEAEAEAEYTEILAAFNAIKEKYSKGNDKEVIAFISAFTVFTAEIQDQIS